MTAAWKSLRDTEWVNIVNHPKVLYASDKEEAVAEAFKLIEAKLRELNECRLPAADTIELPARAIRPLTGGLVLDLEPSDAQQVPSFTEVSRG